MFVVINCFAHTLEFFYLQVPLASLPERNEAELVPESDFVISYLKHAQDHILPDVTFVEKSVAH